MKFLEKQIQKEMMKYYCINCFLFFIFYFFNESNRFFIFFSDDDDDNNVFTLGDAVLFAWNKWKNRLEHPYAVTVWALSLQLDIRIDCMEQLSTDNGDLRKMVDEVVSRLHYQPCPNKKVVNKTIDQILDIFLKELKHFIYKTGPYSYQSSWFENNDALSGRSYLWHKMHSLPFTRSLGLSHAKPRQKSWYRFCRAVLEQCKDY